MKPIPILLGVLIGVAAGLAASHTFDHQTLIYTGVFAGGVLVGAGAAWAFFMHSFGGVFH